MDRPTTNLLRDNATEKSKLNRPQTSKGTLVATAMDATMIALLGGKTVHNNQVALTLTQASALKKIYGYTDDKDENELVQAGNLRNMLREASNDGMRVMAFMSRYLDGAEHEDPVRFLQMVFSDVGYDVPDMPDDDEY